MPFGLTYHETRDIISRIYFQNPVLNNLPENIRQIKIYLGDLGDSQEINDAIFDFVQLYDLNFSFNQIQNILPNQPAQPDQQDQQDPPAQPAQLDQQDPPAQQAQLDQPAQSDHSDYSDDDSHYSDHSNHSDDDSQSEDEDQPVYHVVVPMNNLFGVQQPMEDIVIAMETNSLNKFLNTTQPYDNLDETHKNIPCAICLEQPESDQNVVVTCCSHVFHTDCIGEYLGNHNNKCPVCRLELGASRVVEPLAQNQIHEPAHEPVPAPAHEPVPAPAQPNINGLYNFLNGLNQAHHEPVPALHNNNILSQLDLNTLYNLYDLVTGIIQIRYEQNQVQPDPVQPDPVQPDPVQPDPVQPDPVQPDLTQEQSDPVQSDP
jgi:hypothetical protein